jgi:ubiquinone/menaquinone biosynthesis C-methylase UbiE/uncharacterized protein YbaR (Trm112 family)
MSVVVSMSNDDLIEHLICPDCRKKIVRTSENTLTCAGCGRSFKLGASVIQMLPSNTKDNYEDDAWKTLSHEGIGKPAWMALLHKKDRVLDFYERILPKFDFTGRVLEVGAGTSWASALIKKEHPASLVVATDISPYALEKGVSVARLLDSRVDFRIACNAEHLPFADGYFDVVLSNATIHHFPNTQRGISEIWRVLKKGGRSCALGEVAAGAPFKTILTSRVGSAGKRSRSLKIEEKVYSLKKWRKFFSTCGFRDIVVDLDKNWEHKLYDWFTASYYRFASTLPNALLGNFLPCNIDIYARKA